MNGPVLLTAENLAKQFGATPLFERLTFAVRAGERIGLVGPNGAGKSTLLKLLAGVEPVDTGTLTRRRGLRVAHVPQAPEFEPDSTVAQVLEAAAAEESDTTERARRVAVTLGRVGFHDPTLVVGPLSGGWRKRLAIGRELVRRPDLLLLDEPTNHLDLDSVIWLERLLQAEECALIVISHDRYFLENVVNRTIELDRKHATGLFEAVGRFSDFLQRRDEALAGQATYQASLANRVRREIEWLRRGPKARTTKAEARIKQAERWIDELQDLDSRSAAGARVDIDFTASERRTRRLLVAHGIGKRFGERTILQSLDLTLTPGRRLGLVGANGSGKTTLLRMLAGELAPDSGSIDRAHDLKVLHFAQDREALDDAASLRRALAPDADLVVYRDRPIHVAAWAARFLFRPEQLDAPVSRLSGGERARALIARLMLRPADVLILDEPTNDLDLDTLEVLEDSIADFPGALVLVTHDRYLLDTVSDQLLALDGAGAATYYADFAQYQAARSTPPRPAVRPGGGSAGASRTSAGRPARLTYLEQREWETIEQRILAAEASCAAAQQAADDPAIVSDATELQLRLAAVETARAEVDALYSRWAELDAKRS